MKLMKFGTKPDLKELSWLYELFEITKNLRKMRLKNAFEFRTEELRMNLDENLSLKAQFLKKTRLRII